MNVSKNQKRVIRGAAALVLSLACGQSAWAGFTYGDLAIVRLAGVSTDSNAQAVFIDEYSPSGVLVGSHPISSAGASALTLSGGGQHDGHLNLSSDGQYLLLGGYRANAGAANPSAATAASVSRVIGRIDSSYNANTSTALNDAYDQTEMTSVMSDNGQRFWTAGSGSYTNVDLGVSVPTTTGGLRYVGAVGASTSVNLSQTQTVPVGAGLQPDSLRNARIINGQIYVTTASPESFGNRGAYKTTVPLPTSGAQTMIPVINNVEGSAPDPTGKNVPKSDLILLDLNPAVPGFDTAYTTGGKADYEKWSLIGGTWTKFSNKAIPSGEDIQAFDAISTPSGVQLYASTISRVYSLLDTAGYGGDFSQTFPTTPLITAQDGTQFRGVAALVPEPSSLTLAAVTGLTLLRRRRRR